MIMMKLFVLYFVNCGCFFFFFLVFFFKFLPINQFFYHPRSSKRTYVLKSTEVKYFIIFICPPPSTPNSQVR